MRDAGGGRRAPAAGDSGPPSGPPRADAPGFHHEAVLYEGPEGFVSETLPFVREGLEAGEAVMVAVPEPNRGALAGALGADAGRVRFAAMETMGRNPGRIISVWREFLDAAGEGGARGVGEPAWAGRSPEELDECRRHEELLNLAFDGGPPWRLLCPYDAAALPEEVLDGACATHPVLRADGRLRPSPAYAPPAAALEPGDDLPPPPPGAARRAVSAGTLGEARRLVAEEASRAGLDAARADDLVLAVSELATNSVLHGGGSGSMTLWRDAGAVVCEVRDGGRLTDPLAGRARPDLRREGGCGMWLVHEVADLVQVRAAVDGTVVRIRVTAG